MNRRDFLMKTVYRGCALGMPVAGLARLTDAEVGVDMAMDVPAGGLVDMLIFNPPEMMKVGDHWRPRIGPLMEVKTIDESGAHLVRSEEQRWSGSLWVEAPDWLRDVVPEPICWETPHELSLEVV